MKKYLLGSLALVLAIGFSSFTNHSEKSQTTFLWQYKTTAPHTAQGYKTNTNYDKVTVYPSCNNLGVIECGLQTSTQTVVSGVARPLFTTTSITFDVSTGLPNGGTDFLQNDAKN